MATLNKIQAQLEKLIGDANQATGNTHTNLTDGVADLISGYGQGGSGITPTGTLSITENGTYDVTEYASVEINVQNYITVADEAELFNTTATDGTIAVITG